MTARDDSWLKSLINQLELVKSLKFTLMLSSSSRKMYFVSYSYLNAISWHLKYQINYCFSQAIPRAQPSRQVPCSTREAVMYNVKQGWTPLCDFLGCVVPTVALQRENVKGELVKLKFPCPRQDLVGSLNGKYRGRCL